MALFATFAAVVFGRVELIKLGAIFAGAIAVPAMKTFVGIAFVIAFAAVVVVCVEVGCCPIMTLAAAVFAVQTFVGVARVSAGAAIFVILGKIWAFSVTF